MSVASHLRIQLEEYDQKIRTFVPHYGTMISVIAGEVATAVRKTPAVVDLGIGTGALALACLQARPDLRLTGIDLDTGMMGSARARLAEFPQVRFVEGDFTASLPPADLFVACVALHHIREPEPKQEFYHKVFAALSPGGVLLSGDCFPAKEPSLAKRHREAWLAHLEQFHSRSEAEGYLEAWKDEDTYFPLEDELGWLRGAGLQPEVLFRQDGFAVVAAYRGD